MPVHINPAEFLLDLVNVDFARDRAFADQRLHDIQAAWNATPDRTEALQHKSLGAHNNLLALSPGLSKRSKILIPLTLIHRNFIKSYRDIVVYGIRIAMYMGKPKNRRMPLAVLLKRFRSCDHDGHSLAPTLHHPRRYSTVHQFHRLTPLLCGFLPDILN